jgi:hypothetical protein
MKFPSRIATRVASPLVLASLGFFALHCSSDEGGTSTNTGGSGTTAGSGGNASGGSSSGSSSGGMTAGGSVSTGGAGASTGGAGASTGGAGASTGGSGGASGGSGGASGGSGGASGGSGGGSGVTFAQVTTLLAASCKGGNCHDKGNAKNNIDLVTMDGLYTRLTTPIPDTTSHCGGGMTTLVVPNDTAKSFLYVAVAGPTNDKVSCSKKGGGTEMIARMPDDCPGQRPCLNADQIKLISDWITGGAKQ